MYEMVNVGGSSEFKLAEWSGILQEQVFLSWWYFRRGSRVQI